MRAFPHLLLGMALLALAAGLGACAGSVSPATMPPATLPYATLTPQAEAVVTDTPGPPRTPQAPTTTAPTPPVLGALYEKRLLSLEWPRTLRQGDSDWVRLALEVDEYGTITPTVTIEGHDIHGQPVDIPNVYDTHRVFVVARLHAVGLEIDPRDDLYEMLQPGRTTTLYWTLRGDEPGTFAAVLTTHLLLQPKDGGAETRLPLAQQTFQIQVRHFLGLNGFWARVLGSFSGLVGILLELPGLIEAWRRLFRPPTPPASAGETAAR